MEGNEVEESIKFLQKGFYQLYVEILCPTYYFLLHRKVHSQIEKRV